MVMNHQLQNQGKVNSYQMTTGFDKNFILTIFLIIIGGVREAENQQRKLFKMPSPRKPRWEETISRLEWAGIM